MLNRLPRHMPPLAIMLDDIGSPTAKEIARAFLVSESTVRVWLKKERAPHPVMLAIFWLTRWGISAVDCEAHNAAIMSAGQARERQERVEILENRIERLGRIAQFGSANDPIPEVAAYAPISEAASMTAEMTFQKGKKVSSTDATKPGSTKQPCGLRHG